MASDLSLRLADQVNGGQLIASVCFNLTKWIQNQCKQQDNYPDHLEANHHSHHQHSNVLNYLSREQQVALISSSTTMTGVDSMLNSNKLYNLTQDNSIMPSRAFNQSELLASSSLAASPLTKLVSNHLLEPLQRLDNKLNYYFSDIWIDSGDERTSKLPFMGAGPWKLIYATLLYLYLIKWLLPKLMRPLKPLELNWPIRLYNLLMVMSNIWAFYHGARILKFGVRCFGCETINHRDYSPQAIELLYYGWLFFLSRLIEWFDTIFFVLRKKERQVTKLHVFHHSFVPLISWTYLKYHPGYTVAFFPLVNTFVHSIMYTYYLLATFGPAIQPYLWWKRYLTSLQIAQFVLILIQLASIPLTVGDKCHYPRGFLYVAFAGAILFLWLFYTYYVDTYSKQQHQRPSTNANQLEENHKSQSKVTQKLENGHKTMSYMREGSSRALSDAIDNAILCENPLNYRKHKKVA